MTKQWVIAFLLLLRPWSVAAFSSSSHLPLTCPLHSTRQSSTLLFVSNRLDLEDNSEALKETNQRPGFRPRQLALHLAHTLVSTIHRRIGNLLTQRVSREQRALDAETAKIQQQSQNWILRTVVGLNLCPFAFPSLKNHQVELVVVRGTDENEIAQVVVDHMLKQKYSASGGNSIVVAPDYYPDDFDGYLNMVQYLEMAPMKELELDDYVQIAPFHPNFVFNFDDSPQKIDNYVNRSPYPMFHILKQNDVDNAVETKCGGDPGKVWRRNAKLLRKFESVMGNPGAVDFLLNFSTEQQMPEYPEDMVNQVMKEIRQDDDGPVEGMVRGVWRR